MIFLFVGRLVPEKGCLLFAEACQKSRLQSGICGGWGTQRTNFNALIRRRTLPDGNPISRVQRWLSRARALVFPSLWYETQGMVVMEAAAKGVPAIVSDGCAARDLIVPNETGLLFRNGDIADLAEKISALQDSQVSGKIWGDGLMRDIGPILTAWKIILATWKKYIIIY